jgi:hypothetical protein
MRGFLALGLIVLAAPAAIGATPQLSANYLFMQTTPTTNTDVREDLFHFGATAQSVAIAPGKLAQGSADASFLRMGAATSLTANPAAYAGLTAADMIDPIAPSPLYGGSLGIAQLAFASAQTIDTLDVATSFRTTANLYYDRAITLHEGSDMATLTNFFDAYQAANGFVPNASGQQVIMLAQVAASANMAVIVRDTGAACVGSSSLSCYARTEVYTSRYAGIYGVSSGLGQIDYTFVSGTSFERFQRPLFNPSNVLGTVSDTTPDPVDPFLPLDIAHHDVGNIAFDFEFLAGHSYELTTQLGCNVQMYGASYYQADTVAACDASHSLYWNGLTDARDLADAPLANVSLTSASGFDYRFASPLSPSLSAGVPEPSSWALMLVGFGLAGGAIRRRAQSRPSCSQSWNGRR